MIYSTKKMVTGLLLATAFCASAFIASSPALAKNKIVKCSNCGTVVTTNRTAVKTEGSGTTGAVVGGVGGAVAGKVIGDSNTAAVVGGAGGALAGNLIGKRLGTKKLYTVQVHLDNGKTIDVDYENDPAFKQGNRVKLVDGKLERL